MISNAAKIFGSLTNHLHYCNHDDCCVRELADQLFEDKNSSVDPQDPHSVKETPQRPNQGVKITDE